jgi:hypothetical protein
MFAQKSAHTVDSLRILRMQINQLYNVLGKVDRKDFDFTHMRAWWIGDDELEDTLRWVYTRMTQDSTLFGGEIEGKAPFYVLATPPPDNDVVALYSGKNVLKGKQLRSLLNAKPEGELYDWVVASWRFGQEIELIDKEYVIKNSFTLRQRSRSDSIYTLFNRYLIDGINHDSTTVATVKLLESASIRFGNRWGAEIRLGDDDFGYPAWSSGNLALLVIYKRAKVGAHIPFAGGRTPGKGLQDFWTSRHMDGTYGLTGEFDFTNFGGSFIFGLRRTDIDGSYVNPDSIRTVRNMVQAWYSNVISNRTDDNLLRYKIGVGFHQLGHDAIYKSGTGEPLSVETTEPPTSYFSPYIKLEYLNQQSAERFGAYIQYYNQWMLGGAWLEIIPNHLRLEVKVGAPVFHKAEYWETTHFLTLNIPITFSLGGE